MNLPKPNRRVAYRRILPLAQTLVFVALTILGCPYIQDAIQRIQFEHRTQENQSSDAGSVGWDPSCIDAGISFWEQAAMGINFPATLAVVVFEPVARMFHLECRRGDYFMHAVTLLFVPILWYGLGCFLDGKSLVPARRFHLNKTLVRSLAAIVAVVTTLAAIAFVLSPKFPLLQALVIAWLLLALLALLRFANSRPAPITASGSGW